MKNNTFAEANANSRARGGEIRSPERRIRDASVRAPGRRGMSADGTEAEATVEPATPPAARGGAANLRPPSTTDEAREWGRRGGIASGEARRKRASLRDELVALLSAEGGVVARSIAVAICGEAKRGNVGAFKAIAQVLGELKEVIGVEADALPPPHRL